MNIDELLCNLCIKAKCKCINCIIFYNAFKKKDESKIYNHACYVITQTKFANEFEKNSRNIVGCSLNVDKCYYYKKLDWVNKIKYGKILDKINKIKNHNRFNM